jgi:1-acyl-sn-glycerol-3-phosphate acyltransferase
MTTSPVLSLPPSAPRGGTSPFWQRFAIALLRLSGWHMRGQWPDVPKMVMIVAPHSSAWDAVWGFAVKLAMDVGIVFMAKKEAFVGPLAWYLRRMGGLAVDRAAPVGVVDQAAAQIRAAERMWFVLAPEGTRRRVHTWKPGFWKIARGAHVPVCCVAFHYPDKVIEVGPLIEPSDDYEADMARIRAWYVPFMGKHRDTR